MAEHTISSAWIDEASEIDAHHFAALLSKPLSSYNSAHTELYEKFMTDRDRAMLPSYTIGPPGGVIGSTSPAKVPVMGADMGMTIGTAVGDGLMSHIGPASSPYGSHLLSNPCGEIMLPAGGIGAGLVPFDLGAIDQNQFISNPIPPNENISKRVLASIEKITEAVETNKITLEAGEFALMILVEATMPSCTPDVSRLISDVLAAYRQQMRDIAAEIEANKPVEVLPTTDFEAW